MARSAFQTRRSPVLVLAVLAAVGCASLGLGGVRTPKIDPPSVSIAEVRLAQSPSNKALASYYCGQYLGPLVCRAFGPTTTISDIHFAFDVELELENPNPIPLPLVQSLFAFTAFPKEASASDLGAVCLTFCENPDHCEQDADACVSDDPEIRDVTDFARAAKDFLFSVAVGEGRFGDLRVRTVPPNDRTRVVVRFGLDPTKMVDLIASLAKGEVDRVKRGELPKLAIPYEIEGTAWVSVESFGRIATAFGPARGEWMLR